MSAIEIFECLSCATLWKSSYAPGHECPECQTNNVTIFDKTELDCDSLLEQNKKLLDESKFFSEAMIFAVKERDHLKQELAEARKDKDDAIKTLVSGIKKLLKPEELKYFEQVLRRSMFNYEMYGIEVPEIEEPFTGAIEIDRKEK